jgi:hypothetical protein
MQRCAAAPSKTTFGRISSAAKVMVHWFWTVASQVPATNGSSKRSQQLAMFAQ